jgi:hypothetical protein
MPIRRERRSDNASYLRTLSRESKGSDHLNGAYEVSSFTWENVSTKTVSCSLPRLGQSLQHGVGT